MKLIIFSIVTMLIWIAASQELIKPSKEQNGRKIVILIFLGTLLTLVSTISLFRNISF